MWRGRHLQRRPQPRRDAVERAPRSRPAGRPRSSTTAPSSCSVSLRSAASPPCAHVGQDRADRGHRLVAGHLGRGSRPASAREDPGRGSPVVAARRSRRVSIGATEATDGGQRTAERVGPTLRRRMMRDCGHGPPRRRADHDPHAGRRAPGPRAAGWLRPPRDPPRRTWPGPCSRPSGRCAAPPARSPGRSGSSADPGDAAQNGGDGPLRGRRSTATPGGGSRHRSQTRWREPGWYAKWYRIQPRAQPL